MPAIHFVEGRHPDSLNNLRRIDEENNEWESGCWSVGKDTAQRLVAGHIYLHKSQSEASHMGGEIISIRVVPYGEKYAGRIVFRFREGLDYKGIKTSSDGWNRGTKTVWSDTHPINTLRQRLVDVALEWERSFGNAPAITSALSEYDAAILIGHTENEYKRSMQGATAVQKGFDFLYKTKRYQVKANRPSGKPGSKVTLVAKAMNYHWDYLVWVLYNQSYEIQEAWLWGVEAYKAEFHEVKRLSPNHIRKGTRIWPLSA